MATLRRSLVIGGIAILAAAGIGGAIALRSYDKATRIDRSVPSVVVRQFLNEYLIRRDAGRAALYSCSDQSGLAALAALRDQFEQEEKLNGFGTQVVPASLVESDGGRSVVVDLRVNQGRGTAVRTRIQVWHFSLREEDGWRVCSAERLPDPTPTPSIQPTAG